MTKSLADLLKSPGLIIAPGAYDALSAKLASQAGAPAVYMTGFGLAGSHLGLPDIGLMSAAEMVDRERAMSAAADARTSKDFKIMARTDARATHDLDEALRRGEAFLKAGADILFVEAPRDMAELEKVCSTFKGVPLLANMVEDGKTSILDAQTLEELGFKIAIYPVSALLAVTKRLQEVYATLLRGEGLAANEPRVTFQTYNEIVGLPELLASAAKIAGTE